MGLTVTKPAYFHEYPDGSKKIHTGSKVPLGINSPFNQYWGDGLPWLDLMKSSAYVQNSPVPGTYSSDGFVDSSTSGSVTFILAGQCVAGTYILKYWGTGTANLIGGYTNTSDTAYLQDAQDETDYDNTGNNGTFSGGTGHASSDVITLASGTTITVDTVSTGVVTEFTVDSSGQTSDSTLSAEETQSSTTGTGTGFSVTPEGSNIINRKAYTIPTRPASYLSVTHSGGLLTKCGFMRSEDEANYDLGKVLSSQFASDIDGFHLFRTMDMAHTNNSNVRVYTDFLPYTYFSYAYDYRNESGSGFQESSPPPRAVAELMNELYAANNTMNKLWYCTPHQVTDACCSSIFSDFNTYLNTNIEIWNEISNEAWNAGGAFLDQYTWFLQETQTTHEGTLTPATASVADTGHGFSWGEGICCFNTIQRSNAYPWTTGGRLFTMVDDADTWRGSAIAADLTAATKANPCVITLDGNYFSSSTAAKNIANASEIEIDSVAGMTELNGNAYTVANGAYNSVDDETTFELSGVDSSAYTTYDSGGIAMQTVIENGNWTPNSNQTLVRYKKYGTNNDRAGTFADRCVALWDLAEAEVPSHTFLRIGATQTASAGVTTGMCNKADYKAAIDYMALTTYFGTGTIDWSDEGYDTDTANAAAYNYLTNPATRFANHVSILGHCRVIAYEGGPSSPDAGGEEEDNEEIWHHNPGIIDIIKVYMNAIADAGYLVHMQFDSHGPLWGMMAQQGDTTDNKYLGYLPFLNDGGTITKS